MKNSNNEKEILPELSNEAFVDFCYQRILGRSADSDGKTSYLHTLQHGETRGKLLLSFLQSKEYSSRTQPSENRCLEFAPPRHFYSPLHDIDLAKNDFIEIFNRSVQSNIIDLNRNKQFALLQSFSRYYEDLPFADQPTNSNRYGYVNGAFGHGDAVTLYSFMRYLNPRKIIEVGSGHSTAVMLDTNEKFLQSKVAITCIEPYPDRLYGNLRKNDKHTITILEKPAQAVPVDRFLKLQRGDILFIDSSHVVKFGSDLHYLFFNVLPNLNKGVVIHMHDIFWPFEYPQIWLLEGRSWNEAYMLKAFLHGNADFRILFFNDYLGNNHLSLFEKYLPICKRNPGCSIWLEKVGDTNQKYS